MTAVASVPDVEQASGTVLFVGDGVSRSAALAAVPEWSAMLGRPLEAVPVDMEPEAADATYGEVFGRVRDDAGIVGAVVTGHKVGMFDAVAARCAAVSPVARRLGEVNVLAARGGEVHADATDVLSIGEVVDDLWPGPGGAVLCLGAGGSARALCLHLVGRAAAPDRVVVCDSDDRRADSFRSVLLPDGAAGDSVPIEVLSGRREWDDVLDVLEPSSLVVNATGLGKADDRSPLSPSAEFPPGATVWDLNYRGPLPLVEHARQQAGRRGLAVEDGTRLFAHGWLAALASVLGIPDPSRFRDAFLRVAKEARR